MSEAQNRGCPDALVCLSASPDARQHYASLCSAQRAPILPATCLIARQLAGIIAAGLPRPLRRFSSDEASCPAGTRLPGSR
jgi:hypothetical protein